MICIACLSKNEHGVLIKAELTIVILSKCNSKRISSLSPILCILQKDVYFFLIKVSHEENKNRSDDLNKYRKRKLCEIKKKSCSFSEEFVKLLVRTKVSTFAKFSLISVCQSFRQKKKKLLEII